MLGSGFAIGVLAGLLFRAGVVFLLTGLAVVVWVLAGFRLPAGQGISGLQLVAAIAAMQIGYLVGVRISIAIRNRLK